MSSILDAPTGAGQSANDPDPALVSRSQTAASVAVVVLAAIAAAAGLFLPGIYRDPAVLVVQATGQDLLTLVVAVPVLAVALGLARRGSRRAHVVWLGVTGYLLYTYFTYAVITMVNELYLVYTTLVWLTLYTFVGGLVRLDADALRADFAGRSVRLYVAFEVGLALLVGALWLSEVVPASLAGTIPASAADAGLPVNPIHSLDLGIVLPGFLLTAYLLNRRHPLGFAFTGVLLAKGATLGLAILAMVATMLQAGQPVPLPQIVVFGVVTLASLGLLVHFLLVVSPDSRPDVPGRAGTGDD